uniref:Serine/threonine-protein phosphatase n=1 Tax=Phaeomonas parva TaxID=124430 RepID=A0A7S1U244_9STRA
MGCVESRDHLKGFTETFAQQELTLTPDELEWHVFARLEAEDEKERQELSAFLQKIMLYTPADDSSLMLRSDSLPGSPRDGDVEQEKPSRLSVMGLNIGSINFMKSTKEVADSPSNANPDGFERVNTENMNSFSFDAGEPVSEQTVNDLRHLYKRGGKLDGRSFRRLTRECFANLRELPNVQHILLEDTPAEKVTVVGDLHGQVRDLLYVLNAAGLPSETHKMIFNGDFVDRGEHSCEVLALLMALQIAYPEHVFLNRGNHEDEALCRVYGFEEEMKQKYDAKTFQMCCVMFKHLPLATTIDHHVLVLHGGLFHRDDVTMHDIDEIPREEYGPIPLRAEGQKNPGWYRAADLSPGEQQYYMYNQVCREILWSDPMKEPGQRKSKRGSGMLIGPDVCYKWLMKNGFDMLVRSHEAVQAGFDLPYKDSSTAHGHLCCATVFSASDYCGIGNKGAFLSFHVKEPGVSVHTEERQRGLELEPVGADTVKEASMYYTVVEYYTGQDKPDMNAWNGKTLGTRILRKKAALSRAFAEIKGADGTVTLEQFSATMTTVMDLELHWVQVVPTIAPETVFTTTKVERGKNDTIEEKRINVDEFLNGFSAAIQDKVKEKKGDDDPHLLEAMYTDAPRLRAIFKFFDKNGDGQISREEFEEGCKIVQERVPEGQTLGSAKHILDIIDFDDSGMIDMNEFFEAFRLSETA